MIRLRSDTQRDRHVEKCRQYRLPYLYLGYWIADSPKMSYKSNFRPLETLNDGQWSRLRADQAPGAPA